jgi:hypothetical protein
MDYTLLKRDALVALCAERGIKHLSHKTKTQMVNLLMAYDAELEDSRRVRERRLAARKAPAALPPVLPVKKKKSGLENLEAAAPLKFAGGITADAARVAAEPVDNSYAARVAMEQAAMIAADADVAPAPAQQQQPKPRPHLLTALLRHYWNYPLLLIALFAPSYKPQVMIQEGQLFPIVTQQATQVVVNGPTYSRVD